MVLAHGVTHNRAKRPVGQKATYPVRCFDRLTHSPPSFSHLRYDTGADTLHVTGVIRLQSGHSWLVLYEQQGATCDARMA